MGSSYVREPNMGNERGGSSSPLSSSSSSSSRKGKKSNSEKPKQPQRGLGVAQLEKIRLHEQMGCSYPPSLHGPFPRNYKQEDMRVQTAYSSSSSTSSASYGFHPSMMMGLGEYDQRPNIIYGDYLPSTTSSWNPGNDSLNSQHLAQPNMTRQLLNLPFEDSRPTKSTKQRGNSLGSNSQNSESSDTQELDLELRLSL